MEPINEEEERKRSCKTTPVEPLDCDWQPHEYGQISNKKLPEGKWLKCEGNDWCINCSKVYHEVCNYVSKQLFNYFGRPVELSYEVRDVIVHDISNHYKTLTKYTDLSKEEKRVLAFKDGHDKCLRYRMKHHENCFKNLNPSEFDNKFKKISDEDHFGTLELLDSIVRASEKAIKEIRKRKALRKSPKKSFARYNVRSFKRRSARRH